MTFVSAQVKITFNPEKKSTYEYRIDIFQNIKQSAMGKDLPIEENMIMKYEMKIKNKKAKETEVQFTCRDISYLLSSPMLKMGYDAENPMENPTDLDKIHEKVFKSVIGTSFTALITPDGSVHSIKGLESIIKEVKKAVAEYGEMGTQLSNSIIRQWLGESALKGMFEQSLKIYPAKDVKQGDSWNTESTYGISNKESTINTSYTLKGIKSDVATVGAEGTVDLNPAGGLDGVLSGTQSGVILINTKTGIPDSSDLTLDVNGSVKQNGMEIKMGIIAKMVTVITKIN